MEELLKALQAANALPKPPDIENRAYTPAEALVCSLANTLFITPGGQINKPQVNEFEKFAPCRIYPVDGDSFGWLVGCICYNDRKYYFG
jgi:hypothetical protein